MSRREERVSTELLDKFRVRIENGDVIVSQYSSHGEHENYDIFKMSVLEFLDYDGSIIQKHAIDFKDPYSGAKINFDLPEYIHRDKALREEALSQVLESYVHSPKFAKIALELFDMGSGDIVREVVLKHETTVEPIMAGNYQLMFQFWLHDIKASREEKGVKGASGDEYINSVCAYAIEKLQDPTLAKAIKAIDEYELGLINFDGLPKEAFQSYTKDYLINSVYKKTRVYRAKLKQQLGNNYNEEIDQALKEKLASAEKTIKEKCLENKQDLINEIKKGIF